MPRNSAQWNAPLAGLRAVAALAVVVCHAAFWTGHGRNEMPYYLTGRLEVSVTVFCVLSGFLLYRQWMLRPLPLRSYAWRRVRRIVPSLWITVLAVFTIYHLLPDPNGVHGHGVANLFRNLFLLQNIGFGHEHTGLTQLWSLSAEIVFYLCLPILGLVIAGRAAHRHNIAVQFVWLAAVGVASVVCLAATVHYSIGAIARIDFDHDLRLIPFNFFIWFVAGMILAVIQSTGVTMNAFALTLICGIVAIAVYLLVSTPIAGDITTVPLNVGQAVTKTLLYTIFSIAIIVPFVVDDRTTSTPVHRFLSLKVMGWLGEISYEFYLVHLVVLEFVMSLLGYHVFTGSTIAVFVMTTVFAVPVAAALHWASVRVVRYVERLKNHKKSATDLDLA